MTITYNLLWLEDELPWLKNARKIIESILDDYGFNAAVTVLSTESDAFKFLAEDNLQNFDLILVDFKIGNNEIGNKFIGNIRSHNLLTEVIFYSSNLQQIRDTIHKEQVDGVYCANRDTTQFTDKFEKVFKTTIKKTQDISSLRGLVLSESSYLDEMLQDISISFINKYTGSFDIELQNYILKKLLIEWKDNNSKLEKLIPALSPLDLVSHSFIESSKKMRIVGQILSMLNNPELITKKDFCVLYDDEIIKIRNILAHCVEAERGGKKVLVTKKGDREFDENSYKQIRQNIRKHANILIAIKAAI